MLLYDGVVSFLSNEQLTVHSIYHRVFSTQHELHSRYLQMTSDCAVQYSSSPELNLSLINFAMLALYYYIHYSKLSDLMMWIFYAASNTVYAAIIVICARLAYKRKNHEYKKP